MKFKVVISTASKDVYRSALKKLLESLNYQDHLDEIVVVVADTPPELHKHTCDWYHTKYGLSKQNVLTYPLNSFEYSSFIALATENFNENYFVMIHDTTQAGPTFWKDVHCIVDSIDPPTIQHLDGLYKFSKPLRIADTFVSTFRNDGGYLRSVDYQSVFVSRGWSLTIERYKALLFDTCPTVDGITSQLNANKTIWFPFADNFNMGIATREFLRDFIRPSFQNIHIDKKAAIEIELNLSHPLNFKSLAKGRWQYASREFGRVVSIEPWKNNTDVYGDGIMRCVCGYKVPDLLKFVRLTES